MLAHDPRSCVQSQSCSLANAFGGKERLEDVRQDFLRNSRTVVCDFHDDTRVLTICADAKLALAAHGVNRVINYVCPDLVQFTAKRIHQKGNTLVVTLDSDSALELVVQDRKRSLQALDAVNVLHRSLVNVC